MERYITLLKVLEEGSFTRAAEALGYSQSAVSQMIQSLESELSVQLLHRSRQGVSLTLEGERLFPYIQSAVNHYSAVQEKVREIRGLQGGLIRIGTLSSYSSQWLPRLIRDFQRQYPDVHFLLHQGDYTTIPEYLRRGEIDFGFTNPDAESAAGFQTIFLRQGGHRAILHPEHPLAAKEAVTLEELSREPFILLETGSFSEPLEAFHALGLEPRMELRMHDNFSVCSMVEASIGVSIMPELALKGMHFRIVQRPTLPPVTRKTALIMKDRKLLPIASQYFISYFLERFPEIARDSP